MIDDEMNHTVAKKVRCMGQPVKPWEMLDYSRNLLERRDRIMWDDDF